MPPALRICLLAAHPKGADAVVGQVDVLPHVDAQHGREVDAAGGDVLLAEGAMGADLVAMGAADLLADGGADGGVGIVLGVHVDGLAAVVGAGVGRAGQEGGQQRELAVLGLDEPDEARAEHGACGDDELAAQGFNGREGRLELFLQRDGDGGWVGGEAVEEEVVVVGH